MPPDLRLRFDRRAEADLAEIADWILGQADAATAHPYVDRIVARCSKLLDSLRGGRVRRKGRPPIRSVPFERSATILYRVGRSALIVFRVLRRGRDVDAFLAR